MVKMAVTVKYDEKRKKYVWRARASVNGQQKERSGACKLKREAQEEGDNAYSNLIRLAKNQIEYDHNLTIEEGITDWFNNYKKGVISESSAILYRSHIKNHIIPELGSYRIVKLNKIVYQKFINRLSEKYAKKTIELINQIFYNFLEFMIHDMRIIDYNIASKVKIQTNTLPKQDESMYYTDDELKKIIQYSRECAKNDKQVICADIYEVLFLTGLRISELLGLQEEDFDASNKLLNISKQLSNIQSSNKPKLTKLKTKDSYRQVIIDERVISILKRRMLENKKDKLRLPARFIVDNYLFSYQGYPLYSGYLRDHLKRVCKRANVKYRDNHALHAFRHTHVKHLIEAGVPEVSIQKRIGHAKSSSVTRIYTHSDLKMNELAAENFSKLISERF